GWRRAGAGISWRTWVAPLAAVCQMRSQGWAPVHPIFTSGPPFRRIRRFPRSKWQDRRNLAAQLHRFSMMRALPQGDSVDPGDFDRLRDAFRQLALGVEALHATGRLHRDIKPSNVMVDSRGRVVLLDFGLVSARRSASAGDSILDPMGGTPAYMSPEQAAGAE